MIPLQFLGKLLKILRSGASPAQIAGGFILGMLLGITPFWSLINIVLVLILIVINVNLAMAIFAYGLFSLVVYLADPVFNSFGYWALVDLSFLRGFWTSLYNLPLVPYTRFNNTVYLGSLLVGILMLIPVYIGVKKFVVVYREKYDARVQKWKWVKAIKGSKVYNWYHKVKAIGDTF